MLWMCVCVCVRCLCVCVCVRREDEDASQCAVPISSSLIKQIVSKVAPEESSQQHILSDFYGAKSSSQPAWPYTSKDSSRYGLHTHTHTFTA